MTLRKAHGRNTSALLVCETMPADELPIGEPEPAREASPNDRGALGRFAPGNALSVKGGKAHAGKSRLAYRLSPGAIPEGAPMARHLKAAVSFRKTQCAELARTVGGGYCGPAPSSIVASAALALAWSRYFSDLAAMGGDPELAVKSTQLADKSRQMLLTAHELCAREAEARKASAPGLDVIERLRLNAAQREDEA